MLGSGQGRAVFSSAQTGPLQVPHGNRPAATGRQVKAPTGLVAFWAVAVTPTPGQGLRVTSLHETQACHRRACALGPALGQRPGPAGRFPSTVNPHEWPGASPAAFPPDPWPCVRLEVLWEDEK